MQRYIGKVQKTESEIIIWISDKSQPANQDDYERISIPLTQEAFAKNTLLASYAIEWLKRHPDGQSHGMTPIEWPDQKN